MKNRFLSRRRHKKFEYHHPKRYFNKDVTEIDKTNYDISNQLAFFEAKLKTLGIYESLMKVIYS